MALNPGSRLGPYEITTLLGVGGMGEVYKARDPRLNRDVAIKVLPESSARDPIWVHRFEREARAVAALSHPNILAIFDVDVGAERPFLVTELLVGETLRALVDRGPLTANVLVDVGVQILSGLAVAHARGIVHRDLKPANIFVTQTGQVKILDFGLAKTPTMNDIDVTSAGTIQGIVLGTVGYMSPEQVRGEAVDTRTDIFAVGTILYEMATGHRAFWGGSPAETMSAVLKEEPPDLSRHRSGAPPVLARIVRQCLDKDADKRFQSAGEVRSALESTGLTQRGRTGGEIAPKSIAVLPFANMSGDPENQYFSDGLAEELINALTRLPGLQVAARTSTFRFRNVDVDIRQIGQDLHVATVLEGSVRRAGRRLRVTAQLINTADGYHVWSERYDREMADVFDIQDDIVQSIVKAIAPALSGDAKKIVRRPTDNLEAYELYLRGLHFWHLRSPSAVQSAIRSFEQVIALDADYALAHAGLAVCYGICRAYGWFADAQIDAHAREASARAVAIDPSLAETNFSRAVYLYFFDGASAECEGLLRRALAINPRMVDAHAYLGMTLASLQRTDEALVEANLVRESDPLSPFNHYLAAAIFCLIGRFDLMEVSARRVLDLQPDAITGLWTLAIALCNQDRATEAMPLAERAVLQSRAPFYLGPLGLACGRTGRTDDCKRLLDELEDRRSRGEYITPIAPLCINVGLGDLEGVRRSLAMCVSDRVPFQTIRITCGRLLDSYLIDPEVARSYRELEATTRK